jgi:hypothetical protein
MEEGGKEEMEGEGGEEVGAWADIYYSPGRGCECHRLHWRGHWLHQAEGTPTRRHGEEARAAATRFFFDSRIKGSVFFVLSCLFCFFLEVNGEASSAGQGQEAVKFRVYMP